MSNYILNSAWKNKMKLKNIFNEKFLNEKDLALQPISFIETENILINDKLKNKNSSSSNNLVIKIKKENKERKENNEKKNYKDNKDKKIIKLKKRV